MGKIELEALRRRARSVGLDPGTLVRAARAQRRHEAPNEPHRPILVDPIALPMDDVRRWVVAACKPSMARCVGEDLCALGFVAYCPLGRKVFLRARARVGRRKMIRQSPVFGSYLFVGEVDDPLQASIHGGISYLVGDSQGALSVPASFVLAINQAELDGKWDETKTPTWAKTFKIGDQVRISAGPFTGFAGLVEACSKAGVRVDLGMFGGKTATTVQPSALELA